MGGKSSPASGAGRSVAMLAGGCTVLSASPHSPPGFPGGVVGPMPTTSLPTGGAPDPDRPASRVDNSSVASVSLTPVPLAPAAAAPTARRADTPAIDASPACAPAAG